jgi:hypothetical protein
MTNELAIQVAQAVQAQLDGNPLHVWSAAIQYGFAGFAVLLVLVLMWVIRQGRQLQLESSAALQRYQSDQSHVLLTLNGSVVQNTEVTRRLGEATLAMKQSVDALNATVGLFRDGGCDLDKRVFGTIREGAG